MSPRWRSALGSERNRPKRCVQNAPRVVQVFWPPSRHPPAASSLVAVERIPARSLPASGSDQPWHHVCSPLAIFVRNRSCCSGVPKPNSVGASRKIPFCVTRCAARPRRSTPPRRSATPRGWRRARRTPRATTPRRTGRRRAAVPIRGGGRNHPGCRRSAAARPGRWRPATPGPRPGTPAPPGSTTGPCGGRTYSPPPFLGDSHTDCSAASGGRATGSQFGGSGDGCSWSSEGVAFGGVAGVGGGGAWCECRRRGTSGGGFGVHGPATAGRGICVGAAGAGVSTECVVSRGTGGDPGRDRSR